MHAPVTWIEVRSLLGFNVTANVGYRTPYPADTNTHFEAILQFCPPDFESILLYKQPQNCIPNLVVMGPKSGGQIRKIAS